MKQNMAMEYETQKPKTLALWLDTEVMLADHGN